MSRTRPEQDQGKPINPAQKFLEWSGGKKHGPRWRMWDREKKEERIFEPKQHFIVLDRLATVTGLRKEGDRKLNYYSNEIRPQSGDSLRVRAGDQTIAEGRWRDIKGLCDKAKWTECIYALADLGDGPETVHVKMTGGSGFAWREFREKHNVTASDAVVQVMGTTFHEDDGIPYHAPVFQLGTFTKEESQKLADEADEELQKYLTAYFAYIKSFNGDAEQDAKTEDNSELPQPVAAGNLEEEDDIPF